YGRECWMGSYLRGALTQVDDSNCQMPCAGDALQYCGSGNYLVLYSTGGAQPVPPSHPPTVGGFGFVGCMTELPAGRTLDAAAVLPDDNMTLEMCAAYCATYAYFGVEFGRECYCGNVPNQGSVTAPLADCNMPCPANGFQWCGAGNRLSVYAKL
ncbi:WSC domain-containing protein, partial [Staphylotrichum tortipilum]